MEPNPPEVITIRLIATCPDSEYDTSFLQGMLNRMSVSFHKYGAVKDAYPEKVSAYDSAVMHLDRYRMNGNTEHLIEAANYLMIEFMHPSHPEAHFTATDSDGSLGRVTKDGEVSVQSNKELT